MWAIAFILTIPALMIIGIIAMGLVMVGESYLPAPDQLIKWLP